MPDSVWIVGGAVAGIGVSIVAICIAVRFMCWLGSALWMLGQRAVELGTALLIHCICAVTGWLQRLALAGLVLLWEAIKAAALFLASLVVNRGLKAKRTLREYSKLVRLYWKEGHKVYDTFDAFREAMRKGDSGPEAQSRARTAFEVLGLEDDPDLTFEALKNRRNQLMAVLHPDRNLCPSPVFAQQVNDAFNEIKHARKWK